LPHHFFYEGDEPTAFVFVRQAEPGGLLPKLKREAMSPLFTLRGVAAVGVLLVLIQPAWGFRPLLPLTRRTFHAPCSPRFKCLRPSPAASYWLDPTSDRSHGLAPDASQAGRDGEGKSAAAPAREPNAMQLLTDMMTSLDAKKLYVWAAFLGLAWSMRSFYGIMLGTFVLSYIGASVVRFTMGWGNRLLNRFKLPSLHRRMWSLIYVLAVLTAMCTLTIVTVPRVVGETNYLSLVIESENPYVFVADGIRNILGPEATSKLETFLLTITPEEGRNFASGVMAAQAGAEGGRVGMDAAAGAWNTARFSRFAKLLEFSLKGYVKSGFYLLQRLVTQSTSFIYKGILSLLLSFMIIWDLPKLAQGARGLQNSRLRFAYDVLAPKVSLEPRRRAATSRDADSLLIPAADLRIREIGGPELRGAVADRPGEHPPDNIGLVGPEDPRLRLPQCRGADLLLHPRVRRIPVDIPDGSRRPLGEA
jgi:hypothetical protein